MEIVDTGTVEREVIAAFPIDKLFFIVTVGLFFMISFPFTFPYNALSLANFHPFVNITYLYGNNFSVGSVEIVLLSIPVGIGFYLLYDAYEWFNGLPRRPFDFICARLKGKEGKVYSIIHKTYSLFKKVKALLSNRKAEDNERNLNTKLKGKEAEFWHCPNLSGLIHCRKIRARSMYDWISPQSWQVFYVFLSAK